MKQKNFKGLALFCIDTLIDKYQHPHGKIFNNIDYCPWCISFKKPGQISQFGICSNCPISQKMVYGCTKFKIHNILGSYWDYTKLWNSTENWDVFPRKKAKIFELRAEFYIRLRKYIFKLDTFTSEYFKSNEFIQLLHKIDDDIFKENRKYLYKLWWRLKHFRVVDEWKYIINNDYLD